MAAHISPDQRHGQSKPGQRKIHVPPSYAYYACRCVFLALEHTCAHVEVRKHPRCHIWREIHTSMLVKS